MENFLLLPIVLLLMLCILASLVIQLFRMGCSCVLLKAKSVLGNFELSVTKLREDLIAPTLQVEPEQGIEI